MLLFANWMMKINLLFEIESSQRGISVRKYITFSTCCDIFVDFVVNRLSPTDLNKIDLKGFEINHAMSVNTVNQNKFKLLLTDGLKLKC